jgi:hypothetical protein
VVRTVLFALILLSAAGFSLRAQGQSGVAAAWDVAANMGALQEDVRKIEPLLRRVDTPYWIKRGAPEAYARQLASSQAAVQQLVAAADNLARNSEQLTLALDAFFELERMELLLNSLREGVRKYQSEELANQFTQVLGANILHRDRLRQHIRDLANAREAEYRTANEEVQRCRGMLLKQTPPPVSKPARTRSRSQR